ncbi:hypothetical protein SPFM15_00080 [Salmonella phage SPFM15]|nr:hypothetical protein SPFM5_00075 [Salmonella phage SPFM5]VFR13704.1 hypothetical protein SPFM15_00080 [Salmonella phage SPFM15]
MKGASKEDHDQRVAELQKIWDTLYTAFYGAKMTPPKAETRQLAFAMIKKKSPVGKRWMASYRKDGKPSTAEIALGYRFGEGAAVVQLAAVYMKHIEEHLTKQLKLYGKQLNIPKNADLNKPKYAASSASSVVQMTTGTKRSMIRLLATTIYRESRFNKNVGKNKFNEIKPLIVTASRKQGVHAGTSYQTTSNKHQKEFVLIQDQSSMFRTILFLLVAMTTFNSNDAVRAVFPDWERKSINPFGDKIIPNSFK